MNSPISFRVTSLALGQSYDSSGASGSNECVNVSQISTRTDDSTNACLTWDIPYIYIYNIYTCVCQAALRKSSINRHGMEWNTGLKSSGDSGLWKSFFFTFRLKMDEKIIAQPTHTWHQARIRPEQYLPNLTNAYGFEKQVVPNNNEFGPISCVCVKYLWQSISNSEKLMSTITRNWNR